MRFSWRPLQLPLVIFLVIYGFSFVPSVRSFVVSQCAPVIIPLRRFVESTTDSLQVVTVIPTLARENGQLHQQVNELKSIAVQNKELTHENELLRKELELTAHARDLIAAQVISRSSSVTQQSIVVNRGSRDGFKKGMTIIAQGYVVGVVDQVDDSSSRVSLITSSQSLVPAVLQGSRAIGLLRGGPGGLILDEVPRDVTIQQGEAIVTAAVGNVVTSGIPVGTVSAVLSGKSDVFQSARITSPIDLSRLEIVFGVK